MNLDLDKLTSPRITDAAAAVLGGATDRNALYRALLEEPLGLPLLGPGAPQGPALKIDDDLVRVVDSLALGGPVLALFAEAGPLRAFAVKRSLWPDGEPRARVFERGAIFPKLRVHPGALLVLDGDRELPLDAGEVAALAEGLTPSEYLALIHKLISAGKGREAAKKMQGRMFYVLGHPSGGPVMFQKEFPVFLHRTHAVEFAGRMGDQFGKKPDHALLAATELFKYAVRGKFTVLIAPGPHAMRLRWLDVR